VKVVLTGEGCDELLAGYNKYRVTIGNLKLGRGYQGIVSASVRQMVKRQIEKWSGASHVLQKLRRTFLCLPAEIRDIYFNNFAVYSPSIQKRLFTPATLARIGGSDAYHASLKYIDDSDAESLLDQLLAADLKTYLPELLMKQDQMSMAASLESRVPFLDHQLVEFANHLPVEMKLRGWTTKYVLRQAMRNVLPKEILRRKKMGFPVPVGSWLRGRFRHVLDEYVLSERTADRGIFNHEYLCELVARHESGENHAERLWMLVNFEIWQRCFFDGESADARGTGQEVAMSA
jgi:asparagine synthase (glutamine-hydrolysing)